MTIPPLCSGPKEADQASKIPPKTETSINKDVPQAKIKLRSSDGRILKSEVRAAKMSATIREHLKNLSSAECATIIVPVPEVESCTLAKVLAWCHSHQNDEQSEKKVSNSEWDTAFMAADPDMVADVLQAANYLAIPGLIHVSNQAMATMFVEKNI